MNQPPLFSRLSFPLALYGSRRRLANLHGDVCVQGIPLDLNHPVGQRADAVLLHRVLCVLDLIEPNGRSGETEEKKEVRVNSMQAKSKTCFFVHESFVLFASVYLCESMWV